MRTVEDILDMSRLEADALKLRRVKIQFPRFVRKAVESLRIQVEAAGLRFSVSIEGGGQFVNGDPQKLERVIFNIIRNAIKFNVPKGAVSVVLRPDPDLSGVVMLEVVDTGIGIAPQHLARITERFFRVGEHISGAGLGLSICKELIEHHGGTIQIQSPPPGAERGTQVTVRLPLADPALVLLLCDEGAPCERLHAELTACGYKVASLPIGAGLDRALTEISPDLMMLDWVADGLEAAGAISTIKRSDLCRQIPLVVLTGATLPPVKQEIIEGFGLPVLRSPWTDDEVCDRLDQVIVGRKDFVT
jgi:CheY-like chemotaxis protein/two-component sensor histidine kinase